MSRLPVRTRLTLLYGLSALVIGAALLAVVYSTLSDRIDSQPIRVEPVVAADGSTTRPAEADVRDRLAATSERIRAGFREQTLEPFAEQIPLLLGGIAACGLLAGWVISGRAVRPVGEITAAARRIASRNVHERIEWGEPRDELRELADTFDDLLARLDEAVGDQWHFVANASHELKTPLAINRTLLEVAMTRPDVTPQLTQLAGTLLEVNERHERLITDLLTLARSEHTVARPVPLDLAEVVGDAVEVVRPEAERAAVDLTLDAGPSRMHGDPALLERLVQNLVQNAIRYNVPDGEVRVQTGTHARSVLLTVENSGPEVRTRDIPGLFEPFRRLQDRVGSTSGTGLGLSIVRSVAQAHGGAVTATPRAGGGLVVRVELPVAERPSSGSPAAPQSSR